MFIYIYIYKFVCIYKYFINWSVAGKKVFDESSLLGTARFQGDGPWDLVQSVSEDAGILRRSLDNFAECCAPVEKDEM